MPAARKGGEMRSVGPANGRFSWVGTERGQGFRLSGLILSFFVLLLVTTSPVSSSAMRNVKQGEPVPDFTLLDLEGMSHTLSAHKGKLVVLSFVRLDQDRSIKVMNDMTRINGMLKSSGLVVFAITSQDQDPASLKAIRDNLNLEYPILLDKDRKLYGTYGLFTLPLTSIVDQHGNLAYEYSSYSRDFEQQITEKARVLLGLSTEEEFEKKTARKEIAVISDEEKEAQKNLQMAKVLLKKGFGSKAIPRLEKALVLDPSLTEASILVGELYIKEGKLDEAKGHFEKALNVDSNSNTARVGLACVLIAQGDLVGAETELKKAMLLNPRPGKAMYHLGRVYEKKGEIQKAMHTYRDAIESLLK